MSVQLITAAAALEHWSSFGAIIDARSEAEYALDHLPGAVNWPSLSNAQRVRVGTLYKQAGPFEAKKLGAALVAANIARHIEQHVLEQSKSWQPLVYCWRGGKRSGALALVLDQIGFRVHQLDGGYKAFRTEVRDQLQRLPQRLQWRVICGPTGSGKTRLLHALARQGAQVLDLEAIANHRSSVLGLIPGLPQPSQKRFETLLWQALRVLDAARPVFVEAESKKVGNLAVPEALMHSIRSGECLHLHLPDDERVALLMEDYAFLYANPALLSQRLQALHALRGAERIQAWQALIDQGHWDTLVRELLLHHYDPGYASSTRRNYSGFASAQMIAAQDRSPASMDTLARALID